MDAVVALAALLVAFGLDRWLGEPPARWHPVVWIGRYLGWTGRRIAPAAGTASPPTRRPFLLGGFAWLAGAALVLAVAITLQHGLQHVPPWAAALLAGLALKPLLAWRMLREETAAVEHALADSLPAARDRLAQLVSSDVTQLEESGVRESAIESLAENLNDSVVAPVFWFLVAGLPGAMLYRFANTADAMWGYRGLRAGADWTWAGKWAARADDVLSWLPARITAMLIAIAAGGLSFDALREEARKTPSPNGGWPMAAMALALGVGLRKPGAYQLNAGASPPRAAHTARALRLSRWSVALLLVLGSIVLGKGWTGW
jgi:adenosylcobinamide-phosphate synthase